MLNQVCYYKQLNRTLQYKDSMFNVFIKDKIVVQQNCTSFKDNLYIAVKLHQIGWFQGVH